jgi:hypothetical protein
MANCVQILQGIDPSCDALNKVGGINKRVWVGQLSMLDNPKYTEDADGYIATIEMATISSVVQELVTFSGKKFKNSTANEVVVGENVNTINQQVTLALYYTTPTEREAIESLINADDVFVCVEGNYGRIEIYGIDLGLNCSAGSGGLGALLNDNTAFIVTLSDEQLTLPKQFRSATNSTLSADIAYLDGISA